MKKWLAGVTGLMMALTLLAGCGGNSVSGNPTGGETPSPDAHVCVFDRQIVTEQYLKRPSTANTKALYYYSCECGKKTTEYFAYTPLGEVQDGYTRYNVQAALANKTVGYGAQIDTDTFMPWNNPLGGALTATEEAMIKQRIADMNLQYTRIKFFPEYFERANDNADPNSFDAEAAGVDFESVEMQSLYKILDICQEYGIKVDLSWYGCNAWYKSYDGYVTDGTWMGYNTSKNWVTAPRTEDGFDGYAEYAENISVMLDYLINEKEYTCIYGFSVIEEMFYDASDTRDFDEYIACCEVIQNRLIQDGLRDELQFIGTTTQNTALNGPAKYFAEELAKTKHIFDICGMPNYRWENATDMSGAMYYFEDIMAECAEEDKGLIISEFCQGGHFEDAVNKTDIDDYEAGLYISRFMIAAADNGIAALNHYILGDTWFNGNRDYSVSDGDVDKYYHKCDGDCETDCQDKWDNADGYVHTMGLWQYRDNDWKAHPEYYFWGLICKYTDGDSTVYRIREQGESRLDKDVMLVAFQLPDSSWSYMIANNSAETQKIAIVNERTDRPQTLQTYVVTESGIPENRAVALPNSSGEINAENGVAHIELAPKSFTVLSNKS
ncbi:MAG: hypothetical protein IJ329_00170 [Clostridia bacterium]|nr:hypothetical protein [Clostridia bacterium]